MRIKTKFFSKWTFDPKWLELLKNELRKRLTNRKVWLIIEKIPSADYIIKIDGLGGRVIFRVNIHERTTVKTIFEKKYLGAIVEHEIKHLNPNVDYQHEIISAPQSILREHGIDAYNYTTKLLTDTFQNYLNEIYANSDMSVSGLKKYLEFEVYKLKRIWVKIHKTLKTVWMLVAAYIEVCHEKLGEPIPNELPNIVAGLQKDQTDVAIYKQIKVAYVTMWDTVKTGQRQVNLVNETHELNELIQNQCNLWL